MLTTWAAGKLGRRLPGGIERLATAGIGLTVESHSEHRLGERSTDGVDGFFEGRKGSAPGRTVGAEEAIDKSKNPAELTDRIHRMGRTVGRQEWDEDVDLAKET